jgi:hypothetical protein
MTMIQAHSAACWIRYPPIAQCGIGRSWCSPGMLGSTKLSTMDRERVQVSVKADFEIHRKRRFGSCC